DRQAPPIRRQRQGTLPLPLTQAAQPAHVLGKRLPGCDLPQQNVPIPPRGKNLPVSRENELRTPTLLHAQGSDYFPRCRIPEDDGVTLVQGKQTPVRREGHGKSGCQVRPRQPRLEVRPFLVPVEIPDLEKEL